MWVLKDEWRRKDMIEKNKIVLTVMLGLAVAVLLLCRAVAPKERATETQQIVETNEVSPAPQVEGIVTQSDGSVIVRGNASFTMAPISSSPPPTMVPESEVRSRSVVPQQ